MGELGGYAGALGLNESSYNVETVTQFSDQTVDIWSNGERRFTANWNSGFGEFDYAGNVLWEVDTIDLTAEITDGQAEESGNQDGCNKGYSAGFGQEYSSMLLTGNLIQVASKNL